MVDHTWPVAILMALVLLLNVCVRVLSCYLSPVRDHDYSLCSIHVHERDKKMSKEKGSV